MGSPRAKGTVIDWSRGDCTNARAVAAFDVSGSSRARVVALTVAKDISWCCREGEGQKVNKVVSSKLHF